MTILSNKKKTEFITYKKNKRKCINKCGKTTWKQVLMRGIQVAKTKFVLIDS